MNESKYYMWRAGFSTIHFDQNVAKEERQWALEKISTLKFSEEQKKQLTLDIETPQKFDDLFNKISSPADRAFVLHLIRTVGHLDGEYSHLERQEFKRVEKLIMENVDADQAFKDALERIEKDNSREEEGESMFHIFVDFLDYDD